MHHDERFNYETSWLNREIEQDKAWVKNQIQKYAKLESQIEKHLLPIFLEQLENIYKQGRSMAILEWSDEDNYRAVADAKAYYPFKHYSIPFILGELALAFPQARLLLYKLRDSKFEAVRISSTLALLLNSEPIIDLNIDELTRFIKLRVLFDLPLSMYTKIL